MNAAAQTTLMHAAELLEAQAALSPASVLSDVLCLGDMTMKCEHCGQPAMRGFWICKRCWEIFGDDE
jgi:hypothetical protein